MRAKREMGRRIDICGPRLCGARCFYLGSLIVVGVCDWALGEAEG